MVEETARAIETMEIRGAGKIARAAAKALKKEAEETDSDDLETTLDEVRAAADRLLDTRPTAISLRNAINHVTADLDDADTAEEARLIVVKRADQFVQSSHDAVDTIGRYGANRIPDGATILTHCHSSASLSAIETAHRDGKEVEVVATETRPRMQGHIAARELADAGVPVTLVVDNAARLLMKDADAVVVGADTVASNGAVINKIGSSMIALCAHEARVPVIVCAETYKFSPDTIQGELVEIEERDPAEVADPADFPGVEVRNPAFDATSPRYVDVIVTEHGVISPHEAHHVIEQHLEISE